jgi:hypothetical protein
MTKRPSVIAISIAHPGLGVIRTRVRNSPFAEFGFNLSGGSVRH